MARLTVKELVATREVIVCGGSGGVGKTTTSTALALSAASTGRKVLALTVDPSKRLAQTLGVDRNLAEPVQVPAELLESVGIEAGKLEAWMLDPRIVADKFVNRFADNEEEAARLINNRLYRQISRMVAGMQEYMAMQALHDFLREGRYDLIVLDTPPSRNALDFLYGPSRLSSFLDGRIFSLFKPGERQSIIRRAASRLVNRVNAAIFGEEYYAELQEFFVSFSTILTSLNRAAQGGLEELRNDDTVAFLLVTSPATESLTDAFFFQRKTKELGLPFRGFVLNRSQAARDERVWPDEGLFGGDLNQVQTEALAKLQALAELERAAVKRHEDLLAHLDAEAGDDAFAVALPDMPTGADDMADLVRLGSHLMEH